MKKLFLLCFISTSIFAQEITGELIINLYNYSSPWDITFELTTDAARWDENYDLTEGYETASDNITSPFGTKSKFDHVLHPCANDTFAVGIYKISAIENSSEQASFYMDWRTSDWSASLDVNFYYDEGIKQFRDYSDSTIIDHSYQTLWDLTSNELETDGLEDYWDNCLALTVDADNHPRIVWGPYPSEIGIFEYRIYRKHGSASWELYDTVDDEVNIYTDTTVYINPPGGQNGTEVYYYVKGAYTERETTVETDPTNTIEVDVQGDEIEK